MQMAERPPYVRFETRAEEDRNASIEAGYYVGRNVDYALITPPGTKDCVEKIASEWLEQIKQQANDGRFPLQWVEHFKALYASWKEDNTIPENGTPIRGWQVLSPAQQQQVLSANVRTVEDLAVLNESGLSRIGMGARDLQNRAKSWLETAADTGKVASENAALKAQIADLQEQVKSLSERLGNETPRRKRAANE